MKSLVYWKDLKDEQLKEMTLDDLVRNFGKSRANWGRIKTGSLAGGWFGEFIEKVNKYGQAALNIFYLEEQERQGKQTSLPYLLTGKKGKPIYGKMAIRPEYMKDGFRY
ncbi:hypothetical protein FACS1894163_09280 [Spirochaetia bacterium]|nr:hypothetical protein FACS1894163_09280 [Spirochaetia bacterium]